MDDGGDGGDGGDDGDVDSMHVVDMHKLRYR